MVRVRGQIDAPLVDIGSVREGYWERKEVLLPRLGRFHKKKGWFTWFKKEQAPKVVLTRLGQNDFDAIDAEFMDLKAMMVSDGKVMQRIVAKVMDGKEATDEEDKFMVDFAIRIRPYLMAMLTKMIIEPEMTFEEVTDMMNALDDFDQHSLLAIVNAMTSEKARALKYVHEQRSQEMAVMREQVRAGI